MKPKPSSLQQTCRTDRPPFVNTESARRRSSVSLPRRRDAAEADRSDQRPARAGLITTLYYFEEVSTKKIGLILGVVESRISQLHASAVLHLRAQLATSIKKPQNEPDGEQAFCASIHPSALVAALISRFRGPHFARITLLGRHPLDSLLTNRCKGPG
jgi:hypothetical protein